jgi:hypothetical protein
MQQYHYLGNLAKIGHILWYVANHGEEWVALVGFSASAWKCGCVTAGSDGTFVTNMIV